MSLCKASFYNRLFHAQEALLKVIHIFPYKHLWRHQADQHILNMYHKPSGSTFQTMLQGV